MKKVFLLSLAVVSLIGCGQKKVVSHAEAWQGFCQSANGAAFNIMTDRQQNISQEAALTHVKKIEQIDAQKYLISLIEEAYKVPLYEQMKQKELSMEEFAKGRYEQCLSYKPS